MQDRTRSETASDRATASLGWQRIVHAVRSDEATRARWLLLGIVVCGFAALELGPLRRTGFWLDEFFALWASDPATRLSEILRQRILPDTNPPAYFLMLYGFRQFASDFIAPLAINVIAIAASVVGVLLLARRANLVPLAIWAACFLLLSGPVLYYFGEARAYLCALSVAFLASWLAAQTVAAHDSAPPLLVFAGLGVVAGLIHVYASLYCSALAFALVCLAWLEPGQEKNLKRGIALGMAAGLTTALTLPSMQEALAKLDWIIFDAQHVVSAAIKGSALSLAPAWVVCALVLLWGSNTTKREFRCLYWLASLTYLSFIVVPLLISFKIPIVSARYWVIGSPGLIVFVGFMLRERLQQASGPASGHMLPRHDLSLLALTALIIVSSVAIARYANNAKLTWGSSEELKQLLAACPDGSVRVANSFKPSGDGLVADGAFVPAFSYLSGKPERVFVQVRSNQTGSLSAASAHCPVIGWAENLDPAWVKSSSDRDLMTLLNIGGPEENAKIVRRRSGYVVLQARDDRVRQWNAETF